MSLKLNETSSEERRRIHSHCLSSNFSEEFTIKVGEITPDIDPV